MSVAREMDRDREALTGRASDERPIAEEQSLAGPGVRFNSPLLQVHLQHYLSTLYNSLHASRTALPSRTPCPRFPPCDRFTLPSLDHFRARARLWKQKHLNEARSERLVVMTFRFSPFARPPRSEEKSPFLPLGISVACYCSPLPRTRVLISCREMTESKRGSAQAVERSVELTDLHPWAASAAVQSSARPSPPQLVACSRYSVASF